MNYKIIIDTLDNSEISKKISENLYNLLIQNNYDALLLDNNLSVNKKVNEINQFGENTIVISNQMNNTNTSEIIYSLYYDNVLPLLINDNLEDILNISKFYQLRLPSNTSQDYYQIIRETPLAESIIIRYENINNSLINSIVENLYQALDDYILGENIYIVKSGDTLYSIARQFDISVNELIDVNNLSSTILNLGQELIIPTPKNNDNDENKDDGNNQGIFNTYAVQSGDSLYKIANQYSTTVNDLIKLNNLTTTALSIGQVLLIPTQINDTYQTYTVINGDSLYKIANKFNTTVNELIELNNLTTNNLSIGQQLLVPKTTFNQTTNYTVVSGDSLYKIANKFNTTVNELIKLNNLTTNNLSIGQQLLIPN